MKSTGVALLVCVALAGCSKDSKKLEFTARELNPDLKPAPMIEAGIDEQELGLPVYPGAKTPKGMPPMVRSSVPDKESKMQVATVEVWLESEDSPDDIATFYRARLTDAQLTPTPNGVLLDGRTPKGEECQVVANRMNGAKLTTLSVRTIKGVSGATQSPQTPSAPVSN